jgi:exopolyphosphatase/guanosine-5'-triphosphate,3'-diphosphate pyrophosphatase
MIFAGSIESTPMTDTTPRYEFRIWAENLADLRNKLQQFAAPARTEASKETYLISSATDGCNAKIRNDLMDIKLLINTERGLEQWKPVLKAGFPLERSVIEAQVFPCLELKAPHLSEPRYPIDEFFDKVLRAQREIAIVAVSKTRLKFALDACQAEFASTTINDLARDTVAVESAHPDAVLEYIRRLGIHGMPNTSYIREIKQILGNDFP